MWAKASEAYPYALGGAPWPTDPDGANRSLRAWLASYMATIAALGPYPLAPIAQRPEYAALSDQLALGAEGQVYVALDADSPDAARADWQAAMRLALGSMVASAQGVGGIPSPDQLLLPAELRLRTTEGQPTIMVTAPTQGEAGQIGIVEGIVIVACTGVIAGAVGWIISQKSEVEAIAVQVEGKTKQAIAAMTRSAEIVEAHTQAEATAGHTLPFSAPELDVLTELRQTIHDTAGWQPPQLKSVPNVAGVTGSVGTGLGVGAAGLIILGGLALLLMKGK